jgi:hypothetical protein
MIAHDPDCFRLWPGKTACKSLTIPFPESRPLNVSDRPAKLDSSTFEVKLNVSHGYFNSSGVDDPISDDS